MGFMRRAAGSINISKRPRPADRGSNDRAVVQRLDSRRGVRLPRPRGEPRTLCFGVFTDPPSLRGQRGGKLLLPVRPRWPSAKLLNRHPASQKCRPTSLTPHDVVPGSNSKVWWRCRNESTHEWEAIIAARTKGSGCPVCAGQIATSTTSLQALHPDLAAEWHPEKNGTARPDNVKPFSGKRVWWLCRVDPSHEWEAIIQNRTRGDGCPICGGWVASSKTSLRALHPDLGAEWHPEKNGLLTPDDVLPGSGKIVWWRC